MNGAVLINWTYKMTHTKCFDPESLADESNDESCDEFSVENAKKTSNFVSQKMEHWIAVNQDWDTCVKEIADYAVTLSEVKSYSIDLKDRKFFLSRFNTCAFVMFMLPDSSEVILMSLDAGPAGVKNLARIAVQLNICEELVTMADAHNDEVFLPLAEEILKLYNIAYAIATKTLTNPTIQ